MVGLWQCPSRTKGKQEPGELGGAEFHGWSVCGGVWEAGTPVPLLGWEQGSVPLQVSGAAGASWDGASAGKQFKTSCFFLHTSVLK